MVCCCECCCRCCCKACCCECCCWRMCCCICCCLGCCTALLGQWLPSKAPDALQRRFAGARGQKPATMLFIHASEGRNHCMQAPQLCKIPSPAVSVPQRALTFSISQVPESSGPWGPGPGSWASDHGQCVPSAWGPDRGPWGPGPAPWGPSRELAYLAFV